MTIVSALEIEGDKLTLSFRGLSSKRFLHQAKILGSQRLNGDVTVVATVSTSGLLPFLFGNEVIGWEGLVVEASEESSADVRQLLEEVVASHTIPETSAAEIQRIGTGSLSTDGIFITVEADDWREHFVLSSDSLPNVSEYRQSETGDGMQISLKLPDGRPVEVKIFGEEQVVAAEKAVAILRSRGAVSADTSSSFKVSRTEDAVEERRDNNQAPGFDFSSTQGSPEIYDAAVGQLYPYLAGTSRISSASREKAEVIAAAAGYLVRNAELVRGQGFETLRSLSISRIKEELNDPRLHLVAKITGRFFIGRGDDDAAVISMIKSDVRQLQLDAIMRFVQLYIDNDPFTDHVTRQKVCRVFVVEVMGHSVSKPIDEPSFAKALDTYRESIKRLLTQPGIVGGAMASHGIFDPAAWKRADKRTAKGVYTGEDLKLIRTVAVRYRGAFQVAARLQKAMGWAPTPWDPVEYVHSLGQYW